MTRPQANPLIRAAKQLAGYWDIDAMDEFDEDYWEMGNEAPHLVLHALARERVYGEYVIGLSNGSLEGALREFGGEPVYIFGYGGMDEMDPIDGGGWARLTSPDTLEGELVGGLGKFTAQRQKPAVAKKRISRAGRANKRRVIRL